MTDSDGLCACGCGRSTVIAKQTRNHLGHKKGEPLRWLRGHSNRKRPAPIDRQPNPGGLCMCGCGGRAPLATRTRAGLVRGCPVRYISGHYHPERPRAKKQPDSTCWQVNCETGCWEWQRAIDRYGYGRFGKRLAHRVVFERLVGTISPDLQIDHLCRNHRCVNPDHLELVTSAENVRRGCRTKLCVADVVDIRVNAAEGEPLKDLADRFGVHPAHVSKIVHGRRWVDVAV
jgi:hypothetical protein